MGNDTENCTMFVFQAAIVADSQWCQSQIPVGYIFARTKQTHSQMKWKCKCNSEDLTCLIHHPHHHHQVIKHTLLQQINRFGSAMALLLGEELSSAHPTTNISKLIKLSFSTNYILASKMLQLQKSIRRQWNKFRYDWVTWLNYYYYKMPYIKPANWGISLPTPPPLSYHKLQKLASVEES